MSTPSSLPDDAREELHASAHDAELLEREDTETGGIGDSVRAVIRQENGLVIKGPDSDAWEWKEEALVAEAEQRYTAKKVAELEDLAEERNLTVSGRPTKEELVNLLLTDDASRPPDDGLPIGYVDEEKSMKGPSEFWAKDEDGNYINR